MWILIAGLTLAHAVTLTAASADLLRPPTELITGLVAGSIMIAAADNIRRFLAGPQRLGDDLTRCRKRVCGL